MKIAVDVRMIGISKYAGITNYLVNFLKTAADLSDIEIIALSDTQIDVPEGIKFRVKPSNSTFIWDQFTLPSLLKEVKADVFLNPVIKAPLTIPCPMAWIINDLNRIAYVPELESIETIFRRLYFGSLARFALSRRINIGAISKYTAGVFSDYFGYPVDKISVIPLSVNPSSTSLKNPNDAKNKYSLPGRYILYLGNFMKHKNVITLIKAYAMLDKNIKDSVKLVLAGEKKFEYSNLLEKCRELSVEGNVIFTGTIDEDYKNAVYKSSEIFVLPSVSEGFGLPLLEAMSNRCACLTSDKGALPEIVGNTDCIFEARNPKSLADKLSIMLESPLKLQSIRTEMHKRSEFFDNQKTTTKILELCRNAAKL